MQGDSTPVAGAVVLVLDAMNDVRARALTDDRGRFAIRIVQPTMFRLRAMRIGLRPVMSTPLVLTGDTTVMLAMASVPVELPAVTARERTQCNLHPDSAMALGALWEDAKTALLAAAITRDRGGYHFHLVDHVRTYESGSGDLRSVQTVETQLYDSRTWASLPPEQLRRDGYVIRQNDTTVFVAPDIETLLSEYFIDTHCFRLAENPGPDSLLAIEFSPAKHVAHAEVQGRLWIDRRSHDLRGVDFRYVNLPAADSSAGGSVEFAHLPTGAWIMSDWTIRAPMLRVAAERRESQLGLSSPLRRGSPRNGMPGLLVKHETVAYQLRVYGGTVRDVWRDSVLIWSQAGRALDVHVTRGVDRTAPAGDETIIYLPGTGRYVVADSTGSARLDGLVHGTYLVDVGTRQLDVLGWPRAHAQIEVGRTVVQQAEFNLAEPIDAARAVCGDDAKLLSPRTGVLIGAVMLGKEAQGHRDVTVSWARPGGDSREPTRDQTRTVRTLSGDGRFLACGVPRDRLLTVRVIGTSTVATTRIAANQVVGILNMSVMP